MMNRLEVSPARTMRSDLAVETMRRAMIRYRFDRAPVALDDLN
jgi:hypothetical protein